jgi:hypothetical protein
VTTRILAHDAVGGAVHPILLRAVRINVRRSWFPEGCRESNRPIGFDNFDDESRADRSSRAVVKQPEQAAAIERLNFDSCDLYRSHRVFGAGFIAFDMRPVVFDGSFRRRAGA